MASNLDLENIKQLSFVAFANDRYLGLLSKEKVTFELDANITKMQAGITGKATVKAWANGVMPTIELTLTEIHKDKLQMLYSTFLKPKLGDITLQNDGNAGTLEISNINGACVKPFVLTLYGIHELCTTGQNFTENHLNPLGIQFLRAFTPDSLKLDFDAENPTTNTIMFEGMADLDLNNNIAGYIGFVVRPYFGLHFLNLGNGGSTPLITFGTPYVASAVAVQNDLITTGGRIYRVTTGGTLGTVAPSHTTGTAGNGAANLLFVGNHPTYTVTATSGKINPESTVLLSNGVNVPADLKVNVTGVTGAVARLTL